jgi:hypothetical protein
LFIDETCVVYQQFGFSFHVRWTELSRFEVQVAVLDFNLEQILESISHVRSMLTVPKRCDVRG